MIIALSAALSILIAVLVVVLLIFRSPETEKPTTLSYEEYNALSGEEQEAYFNTFDSIEDFVAWYNTAKQEYEASVTQIEIGGDGEVDLGDLIG